MPRHAIIYAITADALPAAFSRRFGLRSFDYVIFAAIDYCRRYATIFAATFADAYATLPLLPPYFRCCRHTVDAAATMELLPCCMTLSAAATAFHDAVMPLPCRCCCCRRHDAATPRAVTMLPLRHFTLRRAMLIRAMSDDAMLFSYRVRTIGTKRASMVYAA